VSEPNIDGAQPNVIPEEPSGQSPVTQSLHPAKRNTRRRWLGLLSILAFACLLIGLISVSGYLGARNGTAELKTHVTQTADANLLLWFQQGLDQLQQGNYALAEANFDAVLRQQPGNTGVQQLLATAQYAQTPTATPVPPTPTPIITDKGELLAHARTAYDKQEWDTVINLLDQLRALDSNYERTSVETMRYTALVSRGVSRLNEGDIEAGLYDLDVAATIRDLDAQTESQRQIAAMYQNALYYFGADWEKAIDLLTQVYNIAPGYRDVAAKLFDAYERVGDAYAGAFAWCPAEIRYTNALSVTASPQVEEKRATAQRNCLTATPVGITGTNGMSGTALGPSGVGGRIIYATTDQSTGVYQLYSYDGASGQIGVVEAGGSQPSYQRIAGIVAYSAGGMLHGLYSTGAIGALGNVSGQWPSVSPDGTRVAYTANVNGASTIVIAPINGSSTPVNLVQGTYPAWGPGGLIAYQTCIDGQCGIYVINPDQPSDNRKITTTAGDISVQWSPDGNQIIYMTNYTGNWDIYSASLTGQFSQLTNDSAISAAPTFSPDGSHIAFESNSDGMWGIYIMNSDGSDVRKVVNLNPNHSTWQSERLAWIP
jgi:tetratricopeptide (TPR) repeat protein